MVSIQLDEQTAHALQSAAKGAGVSVNEFVKSLIPAASDQGDASWEMLEREFTALSVEGILPSDFSRADIYTDHD